MNGPIAVAGISTEVGKTVVSALLTQAWQADYWKPVQSGSSTDSDTRSVKALVSDVGSVFHPEAYCLNAPISPHEAAKMEGVRIDLPNIALPKTAKPLVVELAGGLMSPLTDKQTNLDLLTLWHIPSVLVVDGYLGGINHSLLSIEALQSREVPIQGIFFNRFAGWAGEEIILERAAAEFHFHLPTLDPLDKNTIKQHAERFAASI